MSSKCAAPSTRERGNILNHTGWLLNARRRGAPTAVCTYWLKRKLNHVPHLLLETFVRQIETPDYQKTNRAPESRCKTVEHLSADNLLYDLPLYYSILCLTTPFTSNRIATEWGTWNMNHVQKISTHPRGFQEIPWDRQQILL